MVDLSAGNAIRLGSGALFAALGVAVLIVGRRRAGPLALGAHFILAGTWIIAANVGDPAPLARTGLSIVMWTAGLAASALLPGPLAGRDRAALGVALVASLVGAVSGIIHYPEVYTWLGSSAGRVAAAAALAILNGTLVTAAFLLPAFRLVTAPNVDRARVVQAAGLSLPGALWVGAGLLAAMTTNPGAIATFAAGLLILSMLAAAWLVGAARGGGLTAIAVAWVVLGVAFAGYAIEAFADVVVGEDPYGVTGIARILGWAAAAIAILRADLLGVRLPRLAVSRGAITTTVVASFFIAAEVAQNFLADAYGLLMGGVVAGAILFAASPIQRAMERLTVRDHAQPSAKEARASYVEAYRAAVRAALEDGAMTPRKEEHLADVAEQLGLGPRDALRIRREVEDERRDRDELEVPP